jgi:hypothetical protein
VNLFRFDSTTKTGVLTRPNRSNFKLKLDKESTMFIPRTKLLTIFHIIISCPKRIAI